MLRAAIAKALGAEFDSADAEGFVGMGFKGVTGDMGVIKLNARQCGQLSEAGAVAFVEELLGYALHGGSPLKVKPHYKNNCGLSHRY